MQVLPSSIILQLSATTTCGFIMHTHYSQYSIFSQYSRSLCFCVTLTDELSVTIVTVYSETYLWDHLRNRDTLGIKDSYISPYAYSVHRNGPEK